MRILGKQINSNIFSKNDQSHKTVLPQWKKVQVNTSNACSHFKGGAIIDAQNLKGSKFLVHTIRDFAVQSPLLSQRAEELFSTWDVISSSVIGAGTYHRTQWADIGLILAVPPQNIIGTFHRDVWFPNHAGNTQGGHKNTYALADSYFQGLNKKQQPINGATYAQLSTPDDIIKGTFSNHTGTGGYNEILVVGRPNVRIYEGFGPTERVKVCGIYYHQAVKGSNSDIRTRDKNIMIIKKLLAHNNIPVFTEFTCLTDIRDYDAHTKYLQFMQEFNNGLLSVLR